MSPLPPIRRACVSASVSPPRCCAPQLLFLDEPTGALDPRGARDVRALARRLADAGTAVVWSSHDMTEVEDLCAVVTIIDRGRIVCSDTIDALRSCAPAAVYAVRTSDDAAALAMAPGGARLRIGSYVSRGFEISADPDALATFTIALGRAGIAIRALERQTNALESLFLELTGGAAERPLRSAVAPGGPGVREPQAVS